MYRLWGETNKQYISKHRIWMRMFLVRICYSQSQNQMRPLPSPEKIPTAVKVLLGPCARMIFEGQETTNSEDGNLSHSLIFDKRLEYICMNILDVFLHGLWSDHHAPETETCIYCTFQGEQHL